ncbi:HYR-like domain-containing protein, partial [Flavilitoribacter nigricans]
MHWHLPASVLSRSFSVLSLLFAISFSPLLAQNDSPCECVQRWQGGAHWNEDGTINDAPNAPNPLGIIRCGSSAETQSNIKPGNCVYNPDEFTIDVELYPCIDPSTQKEVAAVNPTAGEPIIWLNLDVRPNAGSFQVQINDNSGDKIAWALYYSLSFEAGLNENGISGDCNTLVLAACGVESSNTWNTLPVPSFSQPTNYYLAIWDQDADGDLSVNNFKARFGCGDADILVCNLETGPETTECQTETYTVAVPIMGINGNYVGYDPNATPPYSDPVCLTNSGTTDVTSGTILMTYPKDVATYNIQIAIDADPDDDCPDPIVPENCGATITGDAPVCCEAPQLTCPGDLTISCESSIDPALVGTPEVTDGCGEVSLSHSDVVTGGLCASESVIVRTWTATDEAGNETICEQTITVQDLTAPLAPQAPENVTVSCAALIPEMPDLVAMDNCMGEVAALPSSSITGETCVNNFTIERVWTFVDDCGNTSSISQLITVVDETAPLVPEPPEDVTVDCLSEVPPGMDLTADDGCEGTITVSPEDAVTPGECINDFVILRTWTFEDACGNVSSVSQTITVKDETAPVAPNPPANVTVSCASDVPVEVELTATDNCDGDITVGPTSVTTEGECANDFTIVRTWTFVDICGNTSSVSQTITVKDETAPVAPNPPADVRVSCASDVPAEVELTATDNCDGDITVGPTSVTTEGACANDFTIVRTWTFVDICGNTSSVSQTITVKDEIAPVAPNPPADVRVSCASDVPAEVELTATDNCDGDITVGPTSVTTEGACANDFTIVRTWTFVDICGNTSSVSQTITVKDETAPVAPNPPVDVTVSCASDVPAEVELTATDNCDGDITVDPTSVTTEGACANDFTIVRTWTFVDICGNTSSVSQTITVKDEIAPVAPNPPADVRVSCASDVPAEVELTATDNCDGDITVGPTSVTTEGACANDFTIVRTWTFVDICGNTSSVSQTIKVKDEIAPVAP